MPKEPECKESSDGRHDYQVTESWSDGTFIYKQLNCAYCGRFISSNERIVPGKSGRKRRQHEDDV